MLTLKTLIALIHDTLHCEVYTSTGLTCPITREQAMAWCTKSLEAHKCGLIWAPPHVEVRTDTNTIIFGVPESWPNSYLVVP